jgi:transcriptional regulator GlxA family with amidase domain
MGTWAPNPMTSSPGYCLWTPSIRIWGFCALAGVSQRSLEYLFRDHYGVSPVRYLATRRMHAVRGQLLKMRPDECTVASLATAYGFRHPGRFAQAYRRQFGEFPSATLACTVNRSKTTGQWG